MDNIELVAKIREAAKKSAARKLRNEGFLPAVLYGNDYKNTPISVPYKEFSNLVSHGGAHSIITLNVEDGTKQKSSAVIKEIQRNPVRGDYLHVDFLKINLDQEIDSMLPVNIIGDAEGVRAGGVIQHGIREILIRGIAREMPDHVDVDVSELQIGDVYRVSDIKLPEGLSILSNPEETVVSVVLPAKPVEEEVVTEAEEPGLVGEEKAEAETEGE